SVGSEAGRSGFPARRRTGGLGRPDCVAARDDAVALCAALGHELVEADLPGLTGSVGSAIGTVFNAAMAWIVGYWIRVLGRQPEPGELEPLSQAYWEFGQRVSAADYLLAIEELQRFGRVVARFLQEVDVWLTPTLSTPPLRLGEMVSTPDD